MRALPSEAEGGEADEDRAAHHEAERRVPVAEEVEEADDLARIAHAGKEQADAEHQAGGEGGEGAHARCRTTKTVAMPAPMKARVATSERGESRDRPHTPWPLV